MLKLSEVRIYGESLMAKKKLVALITFLVTTTLYVVLVSTVFAERPWSVPGKLVLTLVLLVQLISLFAVWLSSEG